LLLLLLLLLPLVVLQFAANACLLEPAGCCKMLA
jgi:hypothetical protein